MSEYRMRYNTGDMFLKVADIKDSSRWKFEWKSEEFTAENDEEAIKKAEERISSELHIKRYYDYSLEKIIQREKTKPVDYNFSDLYHKLIFEFKSS